MDNASLDLLKELTQADAISGHEDEVRAIFHRRLVGRGDVAADRMGNIFCTRKGASDGPRILVESHMDEVGFLVQHITERGFVRFLNIGGWWAHTMLAQRVRITTPRGKVEGVIGATPPHLLAEELRNRVMPVEALFIDIGAENRQQAIEEFGVTPGCPIVPAATWTPLNHPRRFAAKAFDNRVGVALVIDALNRLEELPNTVIGAACVQEEVGTRGANVVVKSIEPDLALVLEAPPADDIPGFDPDSMQGRLGHGCQIRLYDPTMITNPRLGRFVIETAKDARVAHQVAVRRSGGTDAGPIHKSGYGVPTIVLGVPIRYIHSHVGVIQSDDYAATLELVLALLARLDNRTVASFH